MGPGGPKSGVVILDLLNFSLAGAREGFGPFLGVYLQKQGFEPASTGFAMSLAGMAGVAATLFLGSLIDRVESKRFAVAAAVGAIALGAGLVVATNHLWVVATGQVLIGVADSAVAPLVAALTLGLVGQDRYPDRVARNEAFNHAGNASNAALATVLGYFFGLGYVAVAIVVMAVATAVIVGRIDDGRIDHEEARGGTPDDDKTTGTVLWSNKGLLLLAGTVLLFQTANGAMLPFIAQALTRDGHDPSLVAGGMTVVAQLTMVGTSLVVPWLARRRGHGLVLTAALAMVALRAGLAAWSPGLWSIGVVQVLEGVAMGFAGVAIPALVASAMAGSGHAGAGLGAVMTAFGIGATLSPLLAGVMAQTLGFPASFLALGGVAIVGLTVWIAGQRVLARAAPADQDEAPDAGSKPRAQPT